MAGVQTIDAIWAKRASDALKSTGLPADDIVKQAGIQPYVLNQESARVPFPRHAQLLHLAAQVTSNGSFGLDLAANGTDPRDSGLLVYAALSSETFGEALKVVQRYMHVLNEAVDVEMELSSGVVRLEFDFAHTSALDLRQAIEFGVVNLVRSLRFLAGVHLRPAEVTFIHPRKHELAKFETFFGCPVRFGARWNSVVFSRRQLVLPIATADRRLLRILIRYGDEILAGRAEEFPDLRHQVEKLIMKRLSRGDAETRTVAHDLGMSERTLARRLNESGVTFAHILDELRHALALTYLGDDRLALSEVALLLGYSELSGFHHAFRRWTGTTPGEWRTKHQKQAQRLRSRIRPS